MYGWLIRLLGDKTLPAALPSGLIRGFGQEIVREVDVEIRLRLQFREVFQKILRILPVVDRGPADNGATATLGTTWKKSIVGITKSSKRLDEVIAFASGMAMTTARAYPSNISYVVTHPCRKIFGNSSMNVRAISVGAGKR